MSEEKKFSFTKTLYQNYKKHFVQKTSLVTLLLIAIVLCLIGGYFLPISLLISIPLIVIPLLSSFINENTVANVFPNSRAITLYKNYPLYFTPIIMGGFKVIEGIIKTVLVYLISSTTLSIILNLTLGMSDPTYVEIFNQVRFVQNTGELQALIEKLLENPTYILIQNITVIVSIGLAGYMMIHHTLTHSYKILFQASSQKNIPMSIINMIHREAFRNFRKDFYQNYYSAFWYIILLFIAGYVGGSLLSLNLLGQSGAQSAIIGLFFGTVLSIYFLPIVYDVYQIMMLIDKVYYQKALIRLCNENPLLQKAIGLSEKEKEEISKSIEVMEAMIKEDEEKNKK